METSVNSSMDDNANSSHLSRVCSEDTPVFCLARTVSISVVLGVIVVLTVIGNIFVIAAYFRDSRIRSSVPNMFILSLSISDLIVGAVSLPLNSVWVVLDYWPFGKIFCQFWLVLDYTSTNVASITIVFISLDRYWLVTKKNAYSTFQTHRRAAIMVASSWVVLFLFYALVTFTLGELAGSFKVDYSMNCELESYTNIHFVFIVTAAEFILPLVLMTCLNAVVYSNIKRRSKGMSKRLGDPPRVGRRFRRTAAISVIELSHREVVRSCSGVASQDIDKVEPNTLQIPQTDNNAIRDTVATTQPSERGTGSTDFRRHRKAAITLSLLVGVFVVVWMPYYVVSVIIVFCKDCVSPLSWELVNYLLWSKSTVNPFLYALVVVRFRENFCHFLGLKRCRKRRP